MLSDIEINAKRKDAELYKKQCVSASSHLKQIIYDYKEFPYLNNIVKPMTAANVATATMKSRRIE